MKENKMSYEEFKEKVEQLLKDNKEGLTWTEIKKKGKFKQKVPNNKWVMMLEKDIGMRRTKIGTKTTWKTGGK